MTHRAVISGLFAAVVTPVRSDGAVDLDAFDRILAFLGASGVDGVCVGGATGEYPHFQTVERTALIDRAGQHAGRRRLLVGVGAPATRDVLELGRAARRAGSEALLLPAPLFFRYSQPDLRAYFADVSRRLEAPCLLYDLPAFTNPISPETAVDLMEHEALIAGIKDSSGDPAHLEWYADRRQGRGWTLFVGDDRLFSAGIGAGWNGGISGVAGFCPELMVRLFRSSTGGDRAETARLQALLDVLIERMGGFPTPWAVRLGLAARGLPNGPLPLPLSPERLEQANAFRAWFPGWFERHLALPALVSL